MTDSTDLPSREEIVDKVATALAGSERSVLPLPLPRGDAARVLDALDLLDLAAELQRRGANIIPPDRWCPHWDIRLPAAAIGPQQEAAVDD